MEEIKNNITFMSIEAEVTYIPEKNEIVDRGKDYVSYGKTNKYPNEVYELYTKSNTLKSIIDTTTDFILGNGVESPEDFINSKGEDLDVIIKKLGVQFLIYGGYAFKVIRDAKLKLIDLLVLDFKTCRVNEDLTKVFVSKKWGTYGSNKADVIDIYNPKKNESIYYYNGVINDDIEVYPTPRYSAVLQSVVTEIAIQNYHLNAIKRGFNASCVINFNNGEPTTEEQKIQIKKDISQKFGGEFADPTLVAFNQNKDSAVTIARIPEDNMDNKYQNLIKSVYNNIFGSFSCQPILCGRTNENIGFNTQEFEESFRLFNRTIVFPYQKQILKSLKQVGLENITIIPFSLELNKEENVSNETTSDNNSIE